MKMSADLPSANHSMNENVNGVSERRRVAFLYNHEAGHQVRHSAAVIAPLVEQNADIDVIILGTSELLLDIVREVAGPGILRVPGWKVRG